MEMIKNFMQEEDGVTAIEYGLIAALISIVIITAVTGAGQHLKTIFELIQTTLGNAIPAAAE